MNGRLHDIVKNKSKKIDKIIRRNYAGSYLNNTKWYKLMDGLTTEFDEIYIKYKLVYDDITEGYLFNHVDFKPYFIEPIKYKEVEWIEIPLEYEYWRNRNNLKAGKTFFRQNLKAITTKINEIGEFKIEQFSDKTKLYAYL
jgi:hypothetical protein